MATAQAVKPAVGKQKQEITLKGSVELVNEYLYCAIGSILYMRGVYPADMFEDAQKYGMSIYDVKDEQLKAYLDGVMKWTAEWMLRDVVTGIVLVINNPDTKEVLERWQFQISCDKSGASSESKENGTKKEKMSESDIRRQIGAVLKQIVASVSLLPATGLDTVSSFNILVYTKNNLDVPADWQESTAQIIPNAQQLRFRQVHTSVHQVDTCVTYRAVDSRL